LKNNLKFIDAGWRILTEVPGWPDAPRKLRIRRLVPVVAPLAAMALLFLWNLTWNFPHIQAAKADQQPLLVLQQEVADLKLASSELHATDVAARAAQVGRALLPEPDQLASVFDTLKENARIRNWDATFHSIPDSGTPPPTVPQVSFALARGKLAPASGNTEPFPSLLAFLDQLSASGPWIDLTRLTLHAGEKGRLTAEIYFRAGCRVTHEKTP
jgi:hypothetical protein